MEKGRVMHSIDMQRDIYTNILGKIQIMKLSIHIYILSLVINNCNKQ